MTTLAHAATWSIAAVAMCGVIVRPWRIPEAAWAVVGASALVISGLLPWQDAARAVAKGGDVYLFLTGMMLLSELARREGLFDFLAAHAVNLAHGAPRRLFVLTYAIGIVVTVFMSNDATAVVLTPAVYAAARAFRANAASFVLPISNPANLVIFGAHMPPLPQWLARFALPSALAIAATFAAHRILQRGALRGAIDAGIAIPVLSRAGAVTGFGIVGVAIALLIASSLAMPLGLPTFAVTALVASAVLTGKREAPWAALGDVSWGVLVLVAGLFVLVEGLQTTGLIDNLTTALQIASKQSVAWTTWGAGIAVALAGNLVNNLPMGLIAGSAVAAAHVDTVIQDAITIGVDLGPNLSVTGSLATILWLTAIRREGEHVSAWSFLRLGLVVMPVALVSALGGLLLARAV